MKKILLSLWQEKKYYEVMLQDIVQEKRAIQSYLDLCNQRANGRRTVA